ncbi:hypothetical protein [Deinococcus daejeonensis]|uniref:Periplasmic heavy metal sensor n=1 Tax=Deinococcus daejeonensis TaxID=1007098 RepID=A0ABQ2J1B3_9DEIO|nr:hypothetical protein [Deinococcus daejeonensis]GGN33569.1 hypothetical protein GCM10010842_11360 [Deinococcus daejeonensis]
MRGPLLLLLALPPVHAQAASDPWPGSPVLTRLFVLPSGRADRDRLIRTLDLTVAQVRELERLAGSERAYAQAARTLDRAGAQTLNVKLAAMNAEKDRKVRRLLGAEYTLFRAWVRAWWQAQVRRAAGR